MDDETLKELGITKEQLEDRIKLIEVMNALKSMRNQLDVALDAIDELAKYDEAAAIQYLKTMRKMWDAFLETSMYKEQLNEMAMNDFFGINKPDSET